MKKIKSKIRISEKYFFKTKKASILAYSLIILTMMIVIAATMSIATMLEKKSASSTDFSVQAYATADSGVQLAIKKINSNLEDPKTVEQLFCSAGECTGGCEDGRVKGLTDGGPDSYDLVFYSDTNGNLPVACITEAVGENIKSIKSIATYKSIIRALIVTVD